MGNFKLYLSVHPQIFPILFVITFLMISQLFTATVGTPLLIVRKTGSHEFDILTTLEPGWTSWKVSASHTLQRRNSTTSSLRLWLMMLIRKSVNTQHPVKRPQRYIRKGMKGDTRNKSNQSILEYADTRFARDIPIYRTNDDVNLRSFAVRGLRQERTPEVTRLDKGCFEEMADGEHKWQAVVVYAGMPVRLPCDPCGPVGDDVSWTKQERNQKPGAVPFDETENRLVLGGDFTIYILHAALMDQGIYRCRQQITEIVNTYKLEVKTPTSAMHVVRSAKVGGDGDNRPYGNKHKNGRLQMYTAWAEWGSCSECGKNGQGGERARIGYCYAMTSVYKYPLGLPCSSSEISPEERRMYQRRSDEKMIQACRTYCPKDSIAENMTIFDTLLGKNGIHEQRIVGYVGSDILFECPGIKIDSAVTWHNGSHLIKARDLAKSHGRVTIDIYDGLHIFELHRRDSNPYHCYIDGKRKATFRLVVTKQMIDKNDLLESFVYIGVLIALYTMVFIIIMLCKHNIRRRQRVKNQL